MVFILLAPASAHATVIDYSVADIRFFMSPNAYASAENVLYSTQFSPAGSRFIGIDFIVKRSDSGITGQTPYQIICYDPKGKSISEAEGLLDWHPGYAGISLRVILDLGSSPQSGSYTAQVLINGWETGVSNFTISPRGSKKP